MARTSVYAQDVRARAVRLVLDHSSGCRLGVDGNEIDLPKVGVYADDSAAMVAAGSSRFLPAPRAHLREARAVKQLEQENRQLRRATSASRAPQSLQVGVRRPTSKIALATCPGPRERWGVEPNCPLLLFSPASNYAATTRSPSARQLRDEQLKPEITRVWTENRRVYGADKVWSQLRREGHQVARCSVERLMRELGIRGVVRGKTVRTTVADVVSERPADLVERRFRTSASESPVGGRSYLR